LAPKKFGGKQWAKIIGGKNMALKIGRKTFA
jgi:hypothetical protein